MTSHIFLKATAVWIAFLAFAFLNGGLRELALIPAWGKAPGLFCSGILLSSFILLLAWIAAPWFGPVSDSKKWGIGIYWLLLTMSVETGLNLLGGKPWNQMLEAYSFKDGNIWSIVLLVILVAPTVAARLREKNEKKNHIHA
jgi:hypothetical protein